MNTVKPTMCAPVTGMSRKKSPLLAADVVIANENGLIVLVKRRHPPFVDYWALPGGGVRYGETLEQAAVREVREETGLDVRLDKLVGTYSDPERDPRGHVVCVAFLGKPVGGELKAGAETKEVKCFERKHIPSKLAFDHKEILRDALSIA